MEVGTSASWQMLQWLKIFVMIGILSACSQSDFSSKEITENTKELDTEIPESEGLDSEKDDNQDNQKPSTEEVEFDSLTPATPPVVITGTNLSKIEDVKIKCWWQDTINNRQTIECRLIIENEDSSAGFDVVTSRNPNISLAWSQPTMRGTIEIQPVCYQIEDQVGQICQFDEQFRGEIDFSVSITDSLTAQTGNFQSTENVIEPQGQVSTINEVLLDNETHQFPNQFEDDLNARLNLTALGILTDPQNSMQYSVWRVTNPTDTEQNFELLTAGGDNPFGELAVKPHYHIIIRSPFVNSTHIAAFQEGSQVTKAPNSGTFNNETSVILQNNRLTITP